MRVLLAATILATMLPSLASAGDPPAATLAGRVTDSIGNPLPDVRIAVVEANRSTQTDLDGRYLITDLPRGTYGVSFSLIGYAPEIRRIRIATDSTVRLDVVLRPTLLELPSLQVTASPLATTGLDSPQPTSILSGSELEAARAPSLGETLEGLAGVRNLSTGQGVGKPVIRGLTSNRILVLADGQRLENQQWGDEHGPNVETVDAERIEVIRGPASVLYGSDAIGGVINVVPRELPDALGRSPFISGRVMGAYATNGEAPDGALMVEGASGPVGFRASLTGRTSGDLSTPTGDLFNSGARTIGGSGAVGFRGGWGTVVVNATHRDERVEIHEDPAEEPGATPFQRVGETRGVVNLNLPLGASRIEVDASYERNRRREFEEADANEVALGLLSETYALNPHYHHAPFGPFGGIAGFSYRRSEFSKFGEETLIPNSSAHDFGVYLFEQTELGRWDLSFGARYDHRTLDVDQDDDLGVTAQTRRYNSVTGNLGVLYRLADPVAVVLNLGRGFRAPSTFDLFSNGVHEGTIRFERGDPTLDNETSFNTDLGLRVQTDRVSAEVGGFVNLIDNYIYPDPTGEIDPASGFQIYDITQGNARLTGFEASAEYHATEHVHLRATADYTHGQNTTTDQPLAFVPPFRVTYGVRLEAPRWRAFDAPYFTFGGESNARQTRPDPEEFAPDGYTIFQAGAGVRIPTGATTLAVDLLVRNLFDQEYASFLSRYKTYALDPGRNLVLRVTSEF